jgi:hypothetical protein
MDYSPRPKSSRDLACRRFVIFARVSLRRRAAGQQLFSALRVHGGEAVKLVSFSDSRQDAANAALDIESRHHEDVRRETLVQSLRALLESREPREALDQKLKEARYRRREAEDVGDDEAELEATRQIHRLRDQLRDVHDPSVPLSGVLEDAESVKYKGDHSSGRDRPKELLRTFANLGIHPTDPAGIRRINVELGGEEKLDWTELIGRRDGDVDWFDDPGAKRLWTLHEVSSSRSFRHPSMKSSSAGRTSRLRSPALAMSAFRGERKPTRRNGTDRQLGFAFLPMHIV